MKYTAHEGVKMPSIGGQAVMEGVMMNGSHHYSLVVRKQDGSIVSHIFPHESVTEKNKFYNLPIIRGIIRFGESLSIGTKTLNLSADYYLEEPDQQPLSQQEKAKQKKKEAAETAVTMVLAFVLALGLFVALPIYISRLLSLYVFHNHYLLGVMEGVIRMILFLAYLLSISKIKDVHRLFKYHGAEHKSINCFEAGLDMTVENVKKMSRYNRRCGTSFLFIIMFVSILIFSLIQITQPLARFLIHLAMIPVIAGVSYEILKLSARSDNKFLKALTQPGIWIQHITTQEPDDEQIEVGIESVRKLFETEHPEYL